MTSGGYESLKGVLKVSVSIAGSETRLKRLCITNKALQNLDGVKAAIVALAAHIWEKDSPVKAVKNLRSDFPKDWVRPSTDSETPPFKRRNQWRDTHSNYYLKVQ